jgi:hypothetical protein
MNSELINEIIKARIKQLREENGAENIYIHLETNEINADLDILYFHLASIKPNIKYHWSYGLSVCRSVS